MRIPTDIQLDRWIRYLYSIDKIVWFYSTDEWKELRQDILEANHYECADCKQKIPAEITRAVTVHHENEVRDRPDLALSRTYTDSHGRVRDNLTPLCARCHNKRHDRFIAAEEKKQLNQERW